MDTLRRDLSISLFVSITFSNPGDAHDFCKLNLFLFGHLVRTVLYKIRNLCHFW